MMQTVEIGILIFLIFSTLTSWTCCLLMKGYILNKPLCRQILLDKFFLSFINAYLLFITTFNVVDYLCMFPKPIPHNLAVLLYFCSNYNFDHILIWIITTASIKVKLNKLFTLIFVKGEFLSPF